MAYFYTPLFTVKVNNTDIMHLLIGLYNYFPKTDMVYYDCDPLDSFTHSEKYKVSKKIPSYILKKMKIF